MALGEKADAIKVWKEALKLDRRDQARPGTAQDDREEAGRGGEEVVGMWQDDKPSGAGRRTCSRPRTGPGSFSSSCPIWTVSTPRDNPVWTIASGGEPTGVRLPGRRRVVVGGPRLPVVRSGRSAEHYLLDDVVPWALSQFGVSANARRLGRRRGGRAGGAAARVQVSRSLPRRRQLSGGRSTTTSCTAAERASTRCTRAANIAGRTGRCCTSIR